MTRPEDPVRRWRARLFREDSLNLGQRWPMPQKFGLAITGALRFTVNDLFNGHVVAKG